MWHNLHNRATVKEGFFHFWERGCHCPQGKVLCQEFEQESSLVSLPRNSPGQRPGFPLVLIYLVFNYGKLIFRWRPTDWIRLFRNGAIYRGSLFSGRNRKRGPGGAIEGLERWNLVQWHIFLSREELWLVPWPKGVQWRIVVGPSAEGPPRKNGSWQSQEPCRRLKLGPGAYF